MRTFVLKAPVILAGFLLGVQAAELRPAVRALNKLFQDPEVLAMIDSRSLNGEKDVARWLSTLNSWHVNWEHVLTKDQRDGQRKIAKEAMETNMDFYGAEADNSGVADPVYRILESLKDVKEKDLEQPKGEPNQAEAENTNQAQAENANQAKAENVVMIPGPAPERENENDKGYGGPEHEGLANGGFPPTDMSTWELGRQFDYMEKYIVKPGDRAEAKHSDFVLWMLTKIFGVRAKDTFPRDCFVESSMLWLKKVEYIEGRCHFDVKEKEQTRWNDLTEEDRTHFTMKYRQMLLIEKFVAKARDHSIGVWSRNRWIEIIFAVFPNDDVERKRLYAGFLEAISDVVTDDMHNILKFQRRMSGDVDLRLRRLMN